MFNNLKTEGLEASEDRLGGSYLLDTDAYDAVIKLAYGHTAASGAMAVAFVFDVNGREHKETIYVTNRKGENFFLNQSDTSKKVPLPGFTTVNDICLVTTNAPLSEQPAEEKTVKIYDRDAGGEVPKNVPVLVDLLGKRVTLGIVRQTVNKTENQNGTYVPIADTRDENFTEKVFEAETKMTVVEAMNGKTEADFFPKWVERNKGNTRDKTTLKAGEAGKSGRPAGGAPQAGGAASGGSRPSLFGKK
jgi:hypothetical protein